MKPLASALLVVLPLSPTALGQQRPQLTRQPGVTWEVHRPATNGMLGDYTQTIFVDDEDVAWIGAYQPFWEEGGMSRFDGTTWTPYSSFEHDVLTSPRFNDIVSDADGLLWIASDGGLISLDPLAGPSSFVRYDRTNTPMPGNQVVDLDIDPDGKLWLAVHEASTGDGGLVRFDPVLQTMDVWTTANGLPWGDEWPGWDWVDFVQSVPQPDGTFQVWFGSGPMDMAVFEDGVFTWFGNDFLPPSAPITPNAFLGKKPLDESGHLWAFTNRGLARRSIDGDWVVAGYPAWIGGSQVAVVEALRGGRAVLGSFGGEVAVWDGAWQSLGNWGNFNHTYTFDEDSTGAIWTGGIGGAAKYENGAWQRYRVTNTGMQSYFVDTIAFGDEGKVYLNGNWAPGVGGFNVFQDGAWANANDFTYGLGIEWGLPSDDTQAFAQRANGNMAIAPSGPQGLFEWDGNTYTELIPQGFSVDMVVEDGRGRLWCAQDFPFVVFRVEADGQVTQLTSNNSPLFSGEVSSIQVDPLDDAFVWITTPFGVNRTNGDVWIDYPRELVGLFQNTTSHLLLDSFYATDGTLWLTSAGNGLYALDTATLTFTNYRTTNSKLESDVVTLVEGAPDSTIWAASRDDVWPYPGGVSRFDGKRWTTWTRENSPLPHEQVEALEIRPIAGGYEVWVGAISEGVAVLTVRDAVLPGLGGAIAR